jgi:gamma-glutamyltranspeptidase/glutathione hydrolase
MAIVCANEPPASELTSRQRMGEGDTTHLCALDADGLGISLTQSNALDFGSHLILGDTGIFLHNRGLGFSLVPGHPAELAPRRRPPHTLSPALITDAQGSLSHLLGTMGGDGQPQILLQLTAHLLHEGLDVPEALGAARLILDAPAAGPFRQWFGAELFVRVESHAPDGWIAGLAARGHRTLAVDPLNPTIAGAAQVIATHLHQDSGVQVMVGGSDPRSPEGGAVGR